MSAQSARRRYGDLFADWEIQIARDLAHRFWCTNRALRRSHEEQDLEQEALIHWLRVRGKYKAERGASVETFMRRVVRRRFLELIRTERAEKRRVNHEAVSTATPVEEEEEPEIVIDPSAEDQVEWGALRAHVAPVLAHLTPRQRQIADLFMDGFPKSAIAEELNISRQTVYDEIDRIRIVFDDKGLSRFAKGT